MSTTAEFVVVYVVKHSTVENPCRSTEWQQKQYFVYSTGGGKVVLLVQYQRQICGFYGQLNSICEREAWSSPVWYGEAGWKVR